MKLLLSCSLFLLLSSCSILGDRQPSGQYQWKKHYVITMHGVRGNAESYGEFHQYVGDVLKKVDPSYEYQAINWTYPVGASLPENWNPHAIADKLNKDMFLGDSASGVQPLIPQLGPHDKISIIAYSMGGQMVMAWYYNTMFNFQYHPILKYSDHDHKKLLEYLERVDNIIGLGAVYWGSLDAQLGWSMLEKGDLTEIYKAVPKIKQFCETPEIQAVTDGKRFTQNLKDGIVERVKSQKKETTQLEIQEQFVRNSVIAACSGVKEFYKYSLRARALKKLKGKNTEIDSIKAELQRIAENINGVLKDEWFSTDLMKVTEKPLSVIKEVMKAVGNTNPREMQHMSLTSDAINEFRLARITHLALPDYNSRFKARWTSIIGAFPCLGKTDDGLTCKGFKSEEYKKMNEAFTTLFSGVVRRETDGPVMSPGANADFIYYIENPGQEKNSVSYDSFKNTADLQASMGAPSKEIPVENMHATVCPALEALPGVFKGVGQSVSKSMLDFSGSLGLDVVIMNKECANPKTCEHPNFKHIIETIPGCDLTDSSCDQKYLNDYFKVSNVDDRYLQNKALQSELGSYVLNLNIRLPKNTQLGDVSDTNILMKYFKFNFIKTGQGALAENRLDYDYDQFYNQIARRKEVLSSYAIVQEYSSQKILRVFFVGRVWPKDGNNIEARSKIASGVPVRFEINLPGLSSRRIVAKVKPTYTTYVDLFMK